MNKKLIILLLIVFFFNFIGNSWAIGKKEAENLLDEANRKAHQLFNQGKYKEAIQSLNQALEPLEKVLGPNHPSVVATSLYILGRLHSSMGNYPKAESLYLRSLKIRENASSPEDKEVATVLNSLGILYYHMGDFEKAIPLAQRALKIRERVLGPEHPDVVNSLNTLSSLYRSLGDNAKVVSLKLRVRQIRKKALGPNQSKKKSLGSTRLDVANSLHDRGLLYQSQGNIAEAEHWFQRSLLLREEALGPEHPRVADSLDSLGVLYYKMEDYSKAELLFKRSLKIREKILGPEHPNLSTYWVGLAKMEAFRQNYQPALDYFKRAISIHNLQIQNIFASVTEEQKLKFIQNKFGAYNAGLSLIRQQFSNDEEAISIGLDFVLQRKGIVFDAQSRMLENLKNNLSEETRSEWEALSASRARLSHLLLSGPKNLKSEEYRRTLDTLQEQIETAEKHLAEKSGLVAQNLKQRQVTAQAVSGIMPKNSALVEFVKILGFDFQFLMRDKWRYLAFVLKPDGKISLLDLGEARELEKHASNLLKTLTKGQGGKDENRQALMQLYRQIWQPVQQTLVGVEKVWISPDGMLNLIPFAALLDDQGKYLLERYQLAYLSSGRELIRKAEVSAKSNLMLVANPDYDTMGRNPSMPTSAIRSRDFRGHFSALPGTQQEADSIPLLIGGAGESQVLTGAQATEGAVKKANSPRILHLATHGFFLKDLEVSLSDNNRGIKIVAINKPTSLPKNYENPLVRSGLAFAGANRASEVTEGDDGILTALEISGINLYGTELVVLSACETGVGEVKNGEGVFGLRRSFALAGAKNLMMSLWPVSDEITANQMIHFYRNLKNHPPASALRQAQLKTIATLKEKYGYAPPRLWAPFIMQGAGAFEQINWN